MTGKEIAVDLSNLEEQLGMLRNGMSVDDPGYDDIMERHREASDLAAEAIGRVIDKADKDYESFSRDLTKALDLVKEAHDDLEKVEKAISMVAKALDIAGKIIAKVC